MHRVKANDIEKELRFLGRIYRFFVPYMKERTFRLANKVMKVIKHRNIKGLKCDEIYVPREQGEGSLRIRIYSPKAPKEKTFGLLWIHGGGFCFGLPEQSHRIIKEFVEEFGCTVVSPDYTLAIDKPYPAALNDCHLALRYMKEHAEELNIRDDQLFVGGESAGGGLSCALSILCRDQGGISIAFLLPLYPMLDDRMQYPSSINNDAPFWNTKSNENAWKLYLRDAYQKDDVSEYAAAGRLKDHKGLPPAYSFVGDIEPFHDEDLAYFENLKKAGVEAELDIYRGCYHGFDIVRPKAKVSIKAHKKMMERLRFAKENCFKSQNPRSE